MNSMKNIYYLLVSFTGLLFASCNDNFLERFPEDTINDASFWQNTNHLRNYVNNLYNRGDLLPQYSGYNGLGPFVTDNGSDIQVSATPDVRMNGGASVPESGGGWASSDWASLRDINYFMANYGKVVGVEATINRYVGEALVFRAMFYFTKLRQFGNVPFYDELLQTASEGLYNARDSRDAVVQRLIDDLDKAIGWLPMKSEAGGRLNRETAMLLQARIALFEGTWEKYHGAKNTPFKVEGKNGQDFIRKAADVTDALIALGSCELETGADAYRKLFNRNDYAGSREVLFWRKYSEADNLYNRRPSYSWSGSGTGVTKSLIDSYLCIDGLPIDVSPKYHGDATLLDLVNERDPRLSQTVYVNDGTHFTSGPEVFTYPILTGAAAEYKNITGYQVYKGHDPAVAGMNRTGYQGTIYFRYAEALLINAEAKAELGSITQADLDKTVNKLRQRAGVADMTLTTVNGWSYVKEFPSLSNIINEIRRERKVELACEGFRIDDIFRWAAADELIVGKRPLGAKRAQWEGVTHEYVKDLATAVSETNGYIDSYKTGAVGFNGYGFVAGRDYLQALPINELTLNPQLKPQNPGW